MIAGDLPQLSVMQQIASGVSHMREDQPVAEPQGSGKGGPHAEQPVVFEAASHDGSVGFHHGFPQSVGPGRSGIHGEQGATGRLGSDLSSPGPAHAVTDRKKAIPREKRVLVAPPHEADVARHRIPEAHYLTSTRKIVSPTSTWSPA